MRTPRLVRFSSLTPTAWSNGLGRTVELARWPPYGPFDWRLSIATVDRPAAFSRLPGVSRALMALTEGMTLSIDDAPVTLRRYQVARFSGDQDVSAIAVPEPGYDLNLMTRGHCPDLEVVHVDGSVELPLGALAVVVVVGAVVALDHQVSFGDAIYPGPDSLTLHGSGAVAVARIDRLAPA